MERDGAGGTGYTYKLVGWYTQPDDMSGKLTAGTTVTGDATYYAVWEQVWNTYTVTFDLGDAGDIESQTVKYGEKAVKPTLPQTAESYGVFDDWYSGNYAFSFNTKVTCDLTLTAHWSTLYAYDTASLKNAIANTPANGTVLVTKDFTLKDRIFVDKNLTIDGNGKTITGRSGTSSYKADFIFNKDTADITMKDITLTGGKFHAISATVKTLTLKNVTVNGYDTTGFDATTNGSGATLTVDKGLVTCDGCTFTNNKAPHGGAIYVWMGYYTTNARVECKGCTFTGNTTVHSNGGAVCVMKTLETSTFTNCAFTNNAATKYEGTTTTGGNGGAIYVGGNGGTTVVLDGGTFSGNTANGNNGATNGDHVWVTSKQGTYSYLEIRNTKDSSKFPNGEHKGGFFSEVYGIES